MIGSFGKREARCWSALVVHPGSGLFSPRGETKLGLLDWS